MIVFVGSHGLCLVLPVAIEFGKQSGCWLTRAATAIQIDSHLNLFQQNTHSQFIPFPSLPNDAVASGDG